MRRRFRNLSLRRAVRQRDKAVASYWAACAKVDLLLDTPRLP